MLLGLVQLHDKLDIIHGDLKLQNILVSKDINGDLCAKLSDIGIRKQKPRRTTGKYSYFPNQLEAGKYLNFSYVSFNFILRNILNRSDAIVPLKIYN